MHRRVTQTDVARAAGVHRTTVSLALRNHHSIPLTTRRRIKQVAASLQYRPDPSLSALMFYRTATRSRKVTTAIGYITNCSTRFGWKAAPAHAQFYAGASAQAAEMGYTIEHFWLGEYDTHCRLNEILLARGIRGLVVASHFTCTDQPIAFDWNRFSGVKIDFHPACLRLNKVTNDQRAMLQTALRRIVALGYQRIGFVLSQWWDDFDDLAWSAGFLAIQARLPRSHQVPLLCYPRGERNDGAEGLTVGRDALADWIRMHRPDVILAYGPYVLPQLKALGLRVPDDVAFADIFLDVATGTMAGVHQNCRRVGEVAVETLASQLHQNITGLPEFPTSTLVEGSWHDGASLPARCATRVQTADVLAKGT